MTFKPQICYEDNHLIAINKPAGTLSQGDRTGDRSIRDLMMEFIKERDRKPGNVFLHPVHRLDRPVSGLLILAKTSKALSRMTELFRKRQIQKCYVALCHPPTSLDWVEATSVKGFIRKDPKRNMAVHQLNDFKGAKPAETRLERRLISHDYHVIKCWPVTGRTHQIRVQLSSIQMPILGDTKYGSELNSGGFIYLHSYEANFVHPVKKESVTLRADLPNHGLWKELTEDIYR